MFFFHQLGISLVYLVKFIQDALCIIRQYMHGYRGRAKSRCLPHRNRAIFNKQLAGFSDFNEGMIIQERIKMIL